MNRLMQGRGRRGDFAELAVGLNMLSWTESKQVLQGIGEKKDQKNDDLIPGYMQALQKASWLGFPAGKPHARCSA